MQQSLFKLVPQIPNVLCGGRAFSFAIAQYPQDSDPGPLGRMLSFIEFPSITLRFLILDCPTESTLPFYLQEFQRYNVTHVVRCCQPTYSTQLLSDHGIQVHDLPFKDGGVPPLSVVQAWLQLIDIEEQRGTHTTIAVHCVAGLGRAPALVAIALIELLDMQPLDAVEYIRRKRRGSFNKPQIAYLDTYKPTLKKNATKLSLARIFFGRFSSKKDKQPPKQLQTEELASSIPLSSYV